MNKNSTQLLTRSTRRAFRNWSTQTLCNETSLTRFHDTSEVDTHSSIAIFFNLKGFVWTWDAWHEFQSTSLEPDFPGARTACLSFSWNGLPSEPNFLQFLKILLCFMTPGKGHIIASNKTYHGLKIPVGQQTEKCDYFLRRIYHPHHPSLKAKTSYQSLPVHRVHRSVLPWRFFFPPDKSPLLS